MGNLGGYETVTKFIKKIGGPKVFVGLLATGAAVSFGFGAALRPKIEKVKGKILKKKASEKGFNKEEPYRFTCDYELLKGPNVSEGDGFVVLEVLDDVAIIACENDLDTPFVIGIDELKSISNFGK